MKALALSGSTLNATWATTENVYVKKGDTWATGSLQPQAAAATATLKGDLSGVTFSAGDNITLQFPKSGDITYAGQVGTLADIAANFDWATASANVASVVDGKITVAGDVTFQNQQAIVKFTLKNRDDNSVLSVTQLVVKVGSTEYEVNPAAAASEIFVALPGFSSQAITLTATGSDSKTYTYSKDNVTFTNGHYYTRTVKMSVNANAPLSGVFSVSDSKKVKFSKGNLQLTAANTWKFADNQLDYFGSSQSDNHRDLFGWGAANPNNTSKTNSQYTWSEWGDNTYLVSALGSGWRTLTSDEWTYLLNTRSVTNRYCKATINSKDGMVVFPDSYTHPTGVTPIASANTWSLEDWAKMEAAGAVFLPAAGYRDGTSYRDSRGYYWSSTDNGTDNAFDLYFNSDGVNPAGNSYRYYGRSVRLVQDQQ